MKYTGILTTLSVMAAFVAFSSESMAVSTSSSREQQCTMINCQNLDKCVPILDRMDKDCKIKTTRQGKNITVTVSDCSTKFINNLKKTGCGDCKLQCTL